VFLLTHALLPGLARLVPIRPSTWVLRYADWSIDGLVRYALL
jgi:hypothetical protein